MLEHPFSTTRFWHEWDGPQPWICPYSEGMDAEITKAATNRAIMANSILSMLNDTTTAIAAMLDELDGDLELDGQSGEEGFRVGFFLAKHVFLPSGISTILPLICEGAGEQWKDELADIIDAINNAQCDDPIAFIEEQQGYLMRLFEIVGAVAEKMTEKLMATDLGSGEAISDADLADFLRRLP